MAGFEAPLSACAPYVRTTSERQTRLINVQEIVDFVSGLKAGRPDRIQVSTIIGWNDAPAGLKLIHPGAVKVIHRARRQYS